MHPEHYTEVARALTAFAMQTAEAAQELSTVGPTGGEVSPRSARVIAAWRGLNDAQPAYQHPTAEGIAEDEETAEFALICALRALKDALDKTALSTPARQMAAAMLLDSQGPADQTGSALVMARQRKHARVPYAVVMRRVGKALTMAALHGREGTALPLEMLDFVKDVSLVIEQGRIALPKSEARAGTLRVGDGLNVTRHVKAPDYSGGMGSAVLVPYAAPGAPA